MEYFYEDVINKIKENIAKQNIDVFDYIKEQKICLD